MNRSTGFSEGFLRVTTVLYLMMGVSVASMLALAPVIGLALGTDLAQTWPALVLVAPLAGPAVYGVFGCCRAHGDGSTTVLRDYARAWRAGLRRALPLGVVAALFGLVIAVDVVALVGQPFGLVALPVVAMMAVVGLLAWLAALAALEEFGHLKRRDALKAALVCVIRQPAWSLLSLLGLGTWALVLAGRPVLALGVASGPVLYLVWANARHCLRPLRRHLEEAAAGDPGVAGAPAPNRARRLAPPRVAATEGAAR
ncbi:MAG: hypothetical protein LBR19_09315 [Bifidobacteriaceae bacterium]|jgi:uncharacterized membrane protein YesL|nr:hypothetical protein [Bifidobacteriaceae bacterium]